WRRSWTSSWSGSTNWKSAWTRWRRGKTGSKTFRDASQKRHARNASAKRRETGEFIMTTSCPDPARWRALLADALPPAEADPPDAPDQLGRLGPYQVLGVVGRGGMGVVLKALDPALHRVVAIKVLAPQWAASASARRRFTREARAAAAVSHDHVVTIHAVEETRGLPYLVMQYVPGISLEDTVDRAGP